MLHFFFKPLLLSGIFGCVLCLTPLGNILGYESAAISGVLLSLLSLYPLRQVINTQILSVESPKALCFFWLWSQLLLLPPIILLSLNGLRVETCAWKEGFAFWILIPPVSIALIQSLWILGGAIYKKRPWIVVVLVVLGEIGLFLWRLANEPPIARYEWLIGWFAGSIYDEALRLPDSLIVYRFYCLLWAVAFVLLALSWKRWNIERVTAMVGLLAVLFFLRINGSEWMFMHTHASVQKALGGYMETPHAIVYYSSRTLSKEERAILYSDIEFRYAELQSFFQEDPVAWKGRKMESANAERYS